MKINSVKGTNDFLPSDSELRDYLQGKIIETYKNFGFNRIYTPILEDIENLEKSDGGENLSLIYKVLKRGDKFSSAIENKDFNNLADLGLRYDLTLPLSRFYSCHKAELPTPFKCIQVDQVFRAERPQKGRDREFIQCDIDILGSSQVESEIELVFVTSQALLNIGLSNFKIKINDRRILRNILLKIGFEESELDSVCITFDKLDKIGTENVKEELLGKGFDEKVVENFYNFVVNKPKNLDDVKSILGDNEVIDNLQYIIDSVEKLAQNTFGIVFDISLVRGQGYYTGTVFEIESEDFSCSIGGGGRYDNLVGKFDGSQVPAVGFSIGFERIFSILKQKQFKTPNAKKKLAVVYEKTNFVDALSFANTLKDKFNFTLFEMPKKFGKFLAKLEEQDFDAFVDFTRGKEIKSIKNDND